MASFITPVIQDPVGGTFLVEFLGDDRKGVCVCVSAYNIEINGKVMCSAKLFICAVYVSCTLIYLNILEPPPFFVCFLKLAL